MVHAANLGFPRIGLDRELKKATERYWKEQLSQQELLKTASDLRQRHWILQKDRGIDIIPSNDFSLYDQVLDTCIMVGAIPERFSGFNTENLDLYFAMARGAQKDGIDVVAMEMSKWFDTNYHYIVPVYKETGFKANSRKVVEEFKEALTLGIKTRPVLLSPASFILLGKIHDGSSKASLLQSLLPIYKATLDQLSDAGADWVQIDEPCLGMDLDQEKIDLISEAQTTSLKNAKRKLC